MNPIIYLVIVYTKVSACRRILCAYTRRQLAEDHVARIKAILPTEHGSAWYESLSLKSEVEFVDGPYCLEEEEAHQDDVSEYMLD